MNLPSRQSGRRWWRRTAIILFAIGLIAMALWIAAQTRAFLGLPPPRDTWQVLLDSQGLTIAAPEVDAAEYGTLS